MKDCSVSGPDFTCDSLTLAGVTGELIVEYLFILKWLHAISYYCQRKRARIKLSGNSHSDFGQIYTGPQTNIDKKRLNHKEIKRYPII